MMDKTLPVLPITLDGLRNIQARTFKDNSDTINGLSFSDSGDFVITSSNDDSLTLYDLIEGRKQRKVTFQKTGIFDVKFLHTANNVILAGRKQDSTIRLFSLHDNKCVSFFRGHEKQIVHLAVSPDDDLFLSSAADQTVRLWDVRVPKTVAEVNLGPAAKSANIAFDPEGLIFAVTIGTECIKLFDKREYGNGPFVTFDLSFVQDSNWTSIEFSPDGKTILVVTDENHLRLVESYEGMLTNSLTGHTNDDRLLLRAGFTPDSNYIFCGGADHTITFWDRETGAMIKQQTDHQRPIQIVDFNPKYHIMASTCSDLKLWFPSFDYIYRATSASSFGGLNVGYQYR